MLVGHLRVMFRLCRRLPESNPACRPDQIDRALQKLQCVADGVSAAAHLVASAEMGGVLVHAVRFALGRCTVATQSRCP